MRTRFRLCRWWAKATGKSVIINRQRFRKRIYANPKLCSWPMLLARQGKKIPGAALKERPCKPRWFFVPMDKDEWAAETAAFVAILQKMRERRDEDRIRGTGGGGLHV